MIFFPFFNTQGTDERGGGKNCYPKLYFHMYITCRNSPLVNKTFVYIP